MKQILCFGDSNTYGLIPGTTERYEWGVRWTSRLQDRLQTKGIRVIEEGLCGRTTVFDDPLRSGRRGTELLPTLLETHQPLSLVVMMLGTNDCKTVYAAGAEVIGLGMKQLIKIVKEKQPQANILIVSPILLGEDIWNGYDPEFSKESVETSKGLGAVYERIAAEEGVFYLAAETVAVASKRDREHLDQEGHKAFADLIGQKIDDILEGGEKR